MDKIVIHGGKRLSGRIKVSGSKNAALPVLIASLLTDDKCVINNVPGLADIDTTLALLSYIGKNVSRKGNTVTITSKGGLKKTAPYELVKKMRASVLVMGPLLARLGKVKVSLPGGCAIGARPIDIHLKGFEKMGADINLRCGYVELETEKLKGGTIVLRYPSVGATENLLLAAVTAEGKTVIKNAAREPEITDLADALAGMGARIKGAGTKTIEISGVSSLKGINHSIIPDRIESATYLIAAAITRGDITLEGAERSILQKVYEKLAQSGMSMSSGKNFIRAKWVKPLKPVDVRTGVYPDFPTDVQAQWMALMSVVKGSSVIEETVFENRFIHAVELQRLGANISVHGNKVKLSGVPGLSGAPLMASDLRAGAALVLAGLAANGKTDISRIYHLDRGYEQMEKKLRAVGAVIRRVSA